VPHALYWRKGARDRQPAALPADEEASVISLPFGAAADDDSLSLSGAASVGEYLFLAPDEGGSLVLLRHSGNAAYGDATSYPVADFVGTPGDDGDELDLEGMDADSGYLWLAGSHSAVRTWVRDETPSGKIPGQLAEIRQPKARTLLARIPLSDAPPGPLLFTNGAGFRLAPSSSQWRNHG
jgi:Protein of unknown function (DUF3616)